MRLTRLAALAPPFGGPARAAVGGPAATLLGAICARVSATPGLIGLLPGGFGTGKAPAEALRSPPYGELHEVHEGYWYATVPGGVLADDTHLQAEFWGPDPDVLKAIKVAWEAAFSPGMAPLAVAGRVHVTCWPLSARLETEVARAEGAEPLARQLVEFRVVQDRQS